MVAQELALRHPERVERLVLCCTSSGGAGAPSYPLHELEELPEEERLRRSLALSDTRRHADWQRDHPDELAALLDFMRADAAVGADDPDLATGRAAQLDARRHHDTFDRLPAITAPTLVCAGRHDGIAPPSNSEAIVSRIPDARLELFEGGHLFLLQDRRAWSVIVEFLT
jgi:3-oxoadipate enol-lactonase